MAIKAYTYTDNVGETLTVRMDEDKAEIGGFTEGNSSGVMGATPLNRIRGVYAKSSTGKNVFIPCATEDQSLFASINSTTFNYKGVSYDTVSSRGEKRLHGASAAAPAAPTP